MVSRRIPVATYRLQFNRQFSFEDAKALVPYLRCLGISDLYASPIFRARPGSSHGYDVTDPTCLNPELGTESDFEALVQELGSHEMGMLLDIVPNHMAVSPDNPWWAGVQRNGIDSPFAAFFDIDWNTSGEQLNYRRFFDINELVGVRVEIPKVFEVTHNLTLKLVREGKVKGLRIDHIDGLYDPLSYLQRLQNQTAPETKDARTGLYIIVEKILAEGEELPREWPVCGTTGYDFLNTVNALFVDTDRLPDLDEGYSQFIGSPMVFTDVVYQQKKLVIEKLFSVEIRALGQELFKLAQQDQGTASFSSPELTRAVIEIMACLPVYRTYIRDDYVSTRDRFYLGQAFQEVLQRNPDMEKSSGFFKHVLYLDFLPDLTNEQKGAWRHFVLRWQQLTGAIMAKGFEDTTLYIYNRLVSLNEVGGDPGSAGTSIEDYHHYNLKRKERWPHTLNATATHDTKRSEDVRARINVLSEIPDEWQQHLLRWHQYNEPKKRKVHGLPVPEPNMEILLYQTMLGAWPLSEEDVAGFKERLKACAIKSAREAKAFTGWQVPDTEYEDALTAFLEDILQNSNTGFVEDFLLFEKLIAYYGALNSLAQVLLKITSPGVPDFYQGTELWDFSLVDPDNRRQVDFKRRAEMLDKLFKHESLGQQPLVKQLLEHWEDGRLKLYVTYEALNTRRANKALFQDGDYIPLQTVGKRQENICAFARRLNDTWILTIVPRLLTRLVSFGIPPVSRQVWGDDQLLLPEDAPERWHNVFTGEKLTSSSMARELAIGDILSSFPVALLKCI
ncbi:MAG TPA: malto-oligosyltrehalose synthase [Dehalococcoidia bacterium]|nr:malto-oligosyltrehalose synthase [Dehalococcoidia bacterium]